MRCTNCRGACLSRLERSARVCDSCFEAEHMGFDTMPAMGASESYDLSGVIVFAGALFVLGAALLSGLVIGSFDINPNVWSG